MFYPINLISNPKFYLIKKAINKIKNLKLLKLFLKHNKIYYEYSNYFKIFLIKIGYRFFFKI